MALFERNLLISKKLVHMVTARNVLMNTDYDILPELIRSDPIRLRKEFIVIAINTKEEWHIRLKSLRIIRLYSQVFGLFTPLEKQTLTKAFEREFPVARLHEFKKLARSGCSGFTDSWMLFCYCLTVARITLNEATDILNTTREVFKGTSRAHSLEVHLDTIEHLKTNAQRFHQMEAG